MISCMDIFIYSWTHGYTVMYIYIYLCMKNFTESVSGIFAINLFKYKNTALK